METAKISDSNKKVRIPVDETGLEYDKWAKIFNFPIRMGVSRLSGYCNNAFDFHWHDGIELSVVIEGQMEYLVNDKQYILEVGDCVFVNSGAMHSGRSVDGGDCVYLVISFLTTALDSDPSGYFADAYFGGVMDKHSISSMLFKSDKEEHRVIADICRSIDRAKRGGKDGWELEVRGFLFRLWAMLRREAQALSDAREEVSVSVARVKKAIRYMNENYRNKLTLGELAECCNLSKSEFCRSFKSITRQTPFDYLMELRVRKSLRLLTTDGCSVTEAALDSGFSGSSYYTEVFRRYMNCTPREYIKKIKSQKQG